MPELRLMKSIDAKIANALIVAQAYSRKARSARHELNRWLKIPQPRWYGCCTIGRLA